MQQKEVIMRKITSIIVHCSDSPDSMDVGVTEINQWHLQQGWSGIGYHYVIRRNGDIEKGRADAEVGAHAMGNNHDSIGVCWIGRDQPGSAQWWELAILCADLMHAHGIAIHRVLGHNELHRVTKTCPNINMAELRALISVVHEFGPEGVEVEI